MTSQSVQDGKASASKPTQLKFKAWAWTLTILVSGLAIVPIAKAAPLDELTGTLQQTAGQVFNREFNPIGQIQKTVGQGVGGILGSGNPLGNILGGGGRNPLGSIFGGGGGGLGNLLNPFTQMFSQYLHVFNNIVGRSISNVFNDALGGGGGGNNQDPLAIDLGTSLLGGGTSGSLGIPDIDALHRQIEQGATDGGNGGTPNPQIQKVDRFNSNPVTLSQSVKFETDRALNRGFASSVVGAEGQKAMQQEVQGAAQTLQTIQSKAQEAQGMDVTQDVMKNLVALQAGQSALQGGAYTNLMMLRQQTAANSIVMSNISEGVDETNRMQHSEKLAGAVSLINASGNVYLPGSKPKTAP